MSDDAGAADVQGGVVFRRGAGRYFLPATTAVTILPLPSLTRVPGGPPELTGIALAFGEVLPVVDLSERSDVAPTTSRGIREREATSTRAMLVCQHQGDRVAITGIDIVATGLFARAGETVRFEGETLPLFDVAAVVATLREDRWQV